MRVSRMRSLPLEPQAQIGAQPQRQLDPVGLADGVPIGLADVPPRPLAAPVVESGLAVDFEVDEAVEAAEDAKQDVLGLPVARGADVPVASGRRRDARARSATRRAPRATRWACPRSSPGSWFPAGSDGRQAPSGPPAPRGTVPRDGRGSPRRRPARPSAAATSTRRSRSAPRAHRPRSRTAGRSPRSVETDFRQAECHGPARRRSAAPAPRGDCT